VVLSGWGTAETHLGAWAEKSRVPGKWLIPLTKGLTAMQAVTLGTAGNAAALCDLALQNAGFETGAGPILVTGDAGGVGSVSFALVEALGCHVVASRAAAPKTKS